MRSLPRSLGIFVAVVAILLVMILRVWYILSGRDFAVAVVVIILLLLMLGVQKLFAVDSFDASETPSPDRHPPAPPKPTVRPTDPVSRPQPPRQAGLGSRARSKAGPTPELPSSTFYSLKEQQSSNSRRGTFVFTHEGRSYTNLESMPPDVLQVQLESMELFSKADPQILVMELAALGQHQLAEEFDGHIKSYEAGLIDKEELDTRMRQVLAKLKASVSIRSRFSG
jgi:hypothetical protein